MVRYGVLYQGQPADAAAVIYTVPTDMQAIIKQITVVNPTGATRTLALWLDANADAGAILPPTEVLAGGYGSWDGTMALEDGQTIEAEVDVDPSITVTIYGTEVDI